MKAVGLLLQVLIRSYQLLVSPLFPPCCRYFPTCSEYARQAVAVHGPIKGAWLALLRLLRCHPWGGFGYDPVPEPAAGPAPEEKLNAGLGLCPDCRHLDHQAGR